MKKSLLCAAGLVLLSGCAMIPHQPTRQDPFAKLEFETADPAYPDLKLAYVPTQNTKNSLDYGYKGSALAGFDPTSMFQRDIDVYRKNFKSVAKVDTIPEALRSGADVIAVIDMFAKARMKFSLESDVMLYDRNKIRIDTIHAKASGKFSTSVFGAMSGNGPGAVIERVMEDHRRQIEQGLRHSKALIAFAKTHGSAGTAVAAKPDAAAKKFYHSDVDSPLYREKERPRDFAVVVGIEDYSSLPKADFAERDAAAVKQHLLAMGYPERNIIFLTGAQAGRAGIAKYVESWLPRNVKPDSNVFFYFSGHGAPDVSSGQAYLVPWDGDPKFLETTGYPLKRLYGRLRGLKAKEVLVAMDACFSGAGGRSVIPKGARPLVTRIDTSAGLGGKLVVFSASAGDEITGTEQEQGHGLFTYYFLKGLGGEAERGGKVTAERLFEYLKPKVQDAARRENRDQTPALMGSDKDLVIRR